MRFTSGKKRSSIQKRATHFQESTLINTPQERGAMWEGFKVTQPVTTDSAATVWPNLLEAVSNKLGVVLC
jgi:hypothetical protein